MGNDETKYRKIQVLFALAVVNEALDRGSLTRHRRKGTVRFSAVSADPAP